MRIEMTEREVRELFNGRRLSRRMCKKYLALLERRIQNDFPEGVELSLSLSRNLSEAVEESLEEQRE